MAVLLWGASSCGKSTFAATAPGKKLWLSLGDQEHVSVQHRNDVKVADLSSLTPEEFFKYAKSDNPFDLDHILAENTEIETVVFDSGTALVHLALQQAINSNIGASRRGGFVPTIEDPGQAAYGARNALTMKVLNGLLRTTSKHGVHLIVTAHEADPTTDIRDGREVTTHINVQLGGQLMNNVTFRLSEIWYMSMIQNVRKLAVRANVRLRRPMKTRMFSGKGDAEFILEYDADMPDGDQMTIARWYNEWSDNGGKIMTPSVKEQIARSESQKINEVLVRPKAHRRP
jgi:hypothetical protein